MSKPPARKKPAARNKGAARRTSREQRRVAMGQRLLESVERLSDDNESFTTIGVERIAADAGVGRSTFYLYFQDKSELLEVWYAPIAVELLAVYEKWTDIEEAPSREQLRDVLQDIADVYRSHAAALSIIYDATAYDPIVRELVEQFTDEACSRLAKHIRLGQRHGWIGEDVLPRETATWLIWMGQRGGHQLLRLEDEARLARFIDGYRDVVWSSLYAHAPGVASAAA